MINTQNTLGGLTLNQLYIINFTILQRTPYYIKVTANNSGTVTYNYYSDATGANITVSGSTAIATTTIFVIDLTK